LRIYFLEFSIIYSNEKVDGEILKICPEEDSLGIIKVLLIFLFFILFIKTYIDIYVICIISVTLENCHHICTRYSGKYYFCSIHI
jgi:hypothetical protein